MRRGVNLVIPVKGFRAGKSRLAPALPDDERRALARRLALRTVARARAVAAPEAILLLSPDDEALRAAEVAGVRGFRQRTTGLNAGLREICRSLPRIRTVVVAADLPLLEAGDVAALLDAGGVGLSPDEAGSGTNALSLPGPGAIPFRFGEDSFRAHREAASRAGLAVAVIDRPGLRFDLDAPDDLRRAAAARRPLP